MTYITLRLWLTAILITCVLWPLIVFADPLPPELARARADREQRSQTIEIVWHEKKTVYEDQEFREPSQATPKPPATITENRIILIFDGAKIRLHEIPLAPTVASTVADDLRSKLTVFDGDVSGSLLEFDSRPPQAAQSSKGKNFGRRLDVAVAPMFWCVRPLYSLEGPKVPLDLKTGNGALPDSGETAITLTDWGADANERSRQIYLVSPRTFNIIRAERYNTSGRLWCRWDLVYGTADASWIPRTFQVSVLKSDGSPSTVIHSVIESVRFPSSIDPSQFRVPTLVENTTLIDGPTGRIYNINGNGEKVMIKGTPVTNASRWITWLSASGVLLLILTSLGLFRLRKRHGGGSGK